MKYLLSLVFMISCLSAFGQKYDSTHQMSKQDYLHKSKSQHTAGMLLTIGGSGLIIVGLVFMQDDIDYFPGKEVGTAMVIGGAAAVTTGIVLLSASRKNKRNANELDVGVNLKLENARFITSTTWKNKYYPALSLKFTLK